MGKNDFVSIKDLARQLGMDRSHARRYVLKLGYPFQKRRTIDSGGQLTLCVALADAKQIATQRAGQGFTAPTIVAVSNIGHFYVVQLIPELDAKRLKLGFAESLQQRLAEHRTAAPTAKLLCSWPCKRSWERAVIDALTGANCRLISNEVFECDDPQKLIQRGNKIFELLPDPKLRLPVAKHFVLNSP